MKKVFEQEEWDFSQVHEGELIDAWNWESAREIERQTPCMVWDVLPPSLKRWIKERGIWGVPFTHLQAEEKATLFQHQPKNLIHEVPVDHAHTYAALQELKLADVHCFLISHDASKSAILDAFKTWLSKRKKEKFERKSRGIRPGRPIDGNAWLCDLAIFRVSEAGYTRKEAAVLLEWIIKNGRSSAFTVSHYEDAQRDTKRRLREKRSRIELWRAVKKRQRQLGHALFDDGFNAFRK
jgi:hypothetical protein